MPHSSCAKVVYELHFMDSCQSRNGFQFHNDFPIHNQIRDVLASDKTIIITNGYRMLLFNFNTSFSQPMRQ